MSWGGAGFTHSETLPGWTTKLLPGVSVSSGVEGFYSRSLLQVGDKLKWNPLRPRSTVVPGHSWPCELRSPHKPLPVLTATQVSKDTAQAPVEPKQVP